MTRSELEQLKRVKGLVPYESNAWFILDVMIVRAEREHAAEDRHNDLAELADQPLPIAAE